MPLYEYFCAKCDDRFEMLCRSSSENTMECPQCGTVAGKVFSTFRSGKSSSGSPGTGGGSSCGGCTASSCSSC